MIIINRTSNIEEKREIIRNSISITPNKYKVMVDLRNGNITLIKRTQSKFYIQIGEIDLSSKRVTKKVISNLASALNSQIKGYNKDSLICKSHVKSEYGTSGLLDEAYVMTVDNPYYKCAGDMKLYDMNVINYYLKGA